MTSRPSPFDNTVGRQSPFRRQNSGSPATLPSPPKQNATLSPMKAANLSPEKPNLFVRRPSQISHSSDRPSSPFARPTSSLSIPASPSRKASDASQCEQPLSPSPLLSMRQATVSSTLEKLDTPVTAPGSPSRLNGAHSSSHEALPEDSPSFIPPSPANLRPTTQRTVTASTTMTIKPPIFTSQPKPAASTQKLNTIGRSGAYNHIPQPLLHSMRESFEVLDSYTTGTINSAAVSEMLSQLGLDNTPAALKNFFPPSGPAQLNLARYLDVLSGPLADMSQSNELRAAFEAFDVDDSGQIDVSVLRDALLRTAPQPGEDNIQLGEREVDGVLGEFTSRRAFGSKGLHASNAKGDVFRYRDFMANISGGGAMMNGADAAMAA